MKQQIFFWILILALIGIACKEKSESGKAGDPSTVDKNDGTGRSVFQIEPQQSTLKWVGSKPAGIHKGTVPISGGTVTVEGGTVTGGTIEIDMTNLTVQDPQGEMGDNLEAHLKGIAPGKEEDFFNVGKFPKGTYTIASSSVLANDPEATHLINGNLTIKDITKPVSFKARVEIKDNELTASAAPFNIDRTEFDIRFKSKKFFSNLKDDFVNDEFQIGFHVVANKQ